MVKGLVNRILPFSSVDGPGNRTAIFLQGCNFNCLYCHNPETINNCNSCGLCIDSCPASALTKSDGLVVWSKDKCIECDSCLKTCKSCSSPKATWMSVDEVMSKIETTKHFISGITISGGECMLQKEFVMELCEAVKALNLTTFIDSNGSVPFFGDNRLINAIDMVMLDVKAYDNNAHRMLTGQDNQIVLENLDYLASVHKLYEVRTVIVPEILDNIKTVDMVSKKIGKLNPDIRYKLIKYRPIGVRNYMINSHVPSNELMQELHDIAKVNGCKNIVIV